MQSFTGLWGTAAPVEQCECTKKPATILLATVQIGMTEGKGILQNFDRFYYKNCSGTPLTGSEMIVKYWVLCEFAFQKCRFSSYQGLVTAIILKVQGVVIVRKCKGSFCSSSYGWCSELLHVETARCYEPLQQRTKTAQMCSGIGQILERRTEAFVSRSVELLWS